MTPAGCPLGGPCPAGAREGPAGRRRSAERSALHCVHAHCPLGLGHPSSQAGSGPLLGSLSRPLLVLTIHRQIHLPQWTGSPRRAGPRMSWALIGPHHHPAQGERRGEAQGRHLVNEGLPSPPTGAKNPRVPQCMMGCAPIHNCPPPPDSLLPKVPDLRIPGIPTVLVVQPPRWPSFSFRERMTPWRTAASGRPWDGRGSGY